MPAKKKPTKKEEEESSSSDSSSDSSSSGDEAPAPKKKVASKAKAKAKTEEKEPAAEESVAAAADEKDVKEPAEEVKAVFQPPPRAVFKPHTADGEIKEAQDLEYCPTCGLPPDFCKYGTCWAKCQPWCLENYPQYYPELTGTVSIDDAKKKAAEATEKGKTKEIPGGKKIRSASPSIQIKKLSRGGRKCVTSIAGLELFGVKLEEAAKKFKTKFACGAAVVTDDNGGGETVDIQGDFEVEVTDLIVELYKVPMAKITAVDGGTKKKGKGPGGR